MFKYPLVKVSSAGITGVFAMGAVVGLFAGHSKNLPVEVITILVASIIFHFTHTATLKRRK